MGTMPTRYGSGEFLGHLCWQISDNVNSFRIDKLDLQTEIFGPRYEPGGGYVKMSLGYMTWIPAGSHEGITGTVTIPGNVAGALLALNPQRIVGSGFESIFSFIENVAPPDAPSPPDPQMTIGTAGGSTAIRVNVGAGINPVKQVSVTLSSDYVLVGGAFPRPVSTPAHGTISNGTTALFLEPEAAALVAAGAAAYA